MSTVTTTSHTTVRLGKGIVPLLGLDDPATRARFGVTIEPKDRDVKITGSREALADLHAECQRLADTPIGSGRPGTYYQALRSAAGRLEVLLR